MVQYDIPASLYIAEDAVWSDGYLGYSRGFSYVRDILFQVCPVADEFEVYADVFVLCYDIINLYKVSDDKL